MLSLLSGPLSSIVLCVLAGIALRYALWYGQSEASESASIEEEATAGRSGLANLEQQLSEERKTVETVRADYQQLCQEFDRYRQEATTRDSEIRVQLARHTELEATIEQLRHELNHSKDIQRELQAQLDAALVQSDSSDNSIRKQLESLRNELKDTTAELASTQDHLVSATNEIGELTDENNRLALQLAQVEAVGQKSTDRVKEQLDERSKSLEACNGRIGELMTALEMASGDKSSLEDRCQELEERLVATTSRESELSEQVATLSADVRFAEDLRHQLTGLQSAFQQRTEDIQSLTAERESIEAQVTELTAILDEARSEVTAANQESSRLRQQLAAAQAELESLFDERTNLAADLNTLKTTAEQQLATTSHQIAELKRDIELAQGELQQYEAENSALIQELTNIRSRKREELAVAYEKIQTLENELPRLVATREAELQEQFRVQEANAAVQFGAVAAERAQLQEQLERERASRMQTLAQELAAKTAEIRSENDEQLNDLSHQLALLTDQARDLKTEKEEVLHGLHREQDLRTEAEMRLAEVCRQNEQLLADNESATVRMNQFERRMVSLVEELEELEKRLAARDASIGKFRVENKDLAAELERERLERAGLQRSLQVHAETLEHLRADSASLESLLERQAQVQSSLQQHALQLHSVAALDEVTQSAEVVEKTGQPEPSLGVFAFGPMDDQDESSIRRIDPILGVVYTSPPKRRDNLKLISGVGEALERKLNRLGVFKFEQIMRWDSHAVKEFSNILAFKGQIEREGWIQQATELHSKHHVYGKAA